MEKAVRKSDDIDFVYYYDTEDGPISESERVDEIQSSMEDQFNFLVDKRQDTVKHTEE